MKAFGALKLEDLIFLINIHGDQIYSGPFGLYVLDLAADAKDTKNYRLIDTITIRSWDKSTGFVPEDMDPPLKSMDYDIFDQANFDEDDFDEARAEDKQYLRDNPFNEEEFDKEVAEERAFRIAAMKPAWTKDWSKS